MAKIIRTISHLAFLTAWLLVLPVSVEEGLAGWRRWVAWLEDADMLYQYLGPIAFALPAAISGAYLTYWIPRWLAWRTEHKRKAAAPTLPRVSHKGLVVPKPTIRKDIDIDTD